MANGRQKNWQCGQKRREMDKVVRRSDWDSSVVETQWFFVEGASSWSWWSILSKSLLPAQFWDFKQMWQSKDSHIKQFLCYMTLRGPWHLSNRIPFFDAWVSNCLRKEDTVLRLARDDQVSSFATKCFQSYIQGSLLGLVIVGIVDLNHKEEEEEEDKELPRWKKCPQKMQK